MMTFVASVTLLASLAVPIAGAADDDNSYLLSYNGNAAKVAKAVEHAGGTVTNVIDEVGILVASGDAEFGAAAASIRGVSGAAPNATVQWIDPSYRVALDTVPPSPPNTADDDIFFDLQWGHDAVDAPEAWAYGYRGAGARVAVLDGGFDLDHPDLVPNINLGLSMDFTGEGLQYTLADVFSHGSHTAGTVAAADNAFGAIGVAPDAELVLLKVLGDAGSGSFEDVIAGIVYAADVDADVINMSLGATLQKGGFVDDFGIVVTAKEVAELKNMIGKATAYAYQQGTTVIASAGNDGIDYDHAGGLIHLPSDAPHVLSISALGPLGWALDPTTDLDVPAFYTNFGQRVIDFGAPGGNVDFDLFDSGVVCVNPGPFPPVAIAPCWAFDLVFSTGNGGWYWSAGTSMAAPHAAGVAALIVGANGGDMHPAQVAAAMRAGADDLGKRGNDDFYGSGRVNAWGSVQ